MIMLMSFNDEIESKNKWFWVEEIVICNMMYEIIFAHSNFCILYTVVYLMRYKVHYMLCILYTYIKRISLNYIRETCEDDLMCVIYIGTIYDVHLNLKWFYMITIYMYNVYIEYRQNFSISSMLLFAFY